MKQVEGTIASPKGFFADGLHCGLKRKREDIAWLYSDRPTQTAAFFTTNQIQAAPIQITKKTLAKGNLQAVIVNSGNANACTGVKGLENAAEMQQLAAKRLGLETDSVAVASTGVIGQMLPMELVTSGIAQLKKTDGFPFKFHEAILTTDTKTKEIVFEEEINGKTVTISGAAKGSGMIHPNMGTMLAFITSDIGIEQSLLQKMTKKILDQTFNQITIDGDTSTNDTLLVMTNGASDAHIEENSAGCLLFEKMLHRTMETLAKMIAMDGEGATKLIEVQVNGGITVNSARMIAKKIVGSSLVKTAIFGEDPNWGRIICAAGYAKQPLNPDQIDILIGDQVVLKQSIPQQYNVESMKDELSKNEIKIIVDLHQGAASGMAWGCDLTYKYVEINALYHT